MLIILIYFLPFHEMSHKSSKRAAPLAGEFLQPQLLGACSYLMCVVLPLATPCHCCSCGVRYIQGRGNLLWPGQQLAAANLSCVCAHVVGVRECIRLRCGAWVSIRPLVHHLMRDNVIMSHKFILFARLIHKKWH